MSSTICSGASSTTSNSIEDDVDLDYYELEEGNTNVNNATDTNVGSNEDDEHQESSESDFCNQNNSTTNHSSIKKKRMSITEGAGLWWDEDQALNELTYSSSFQNIFTKNTNT
jgi:hypothetical protein